MGDHGLYYFFYSDDKADNPLKKILIIAVNYRNSSPTKSLVGSLVKCQDVKKVKLVIVDNESSNKTRTELESIKENSIIDIHILPSSANRYYWGGAAFALDTVDKSQFKWIIICNNDVTFNDPQFFSHLNEMDIENYPIIGPKIQSSVSKKDLNPFLSNSISTIQDLYYSLYYSNTVTAKFVHAMGSIINRKLMHRNLAEGKGEGGPKIKQIYAPHGSCIIFSSTFFKKGGYLDTGFTIYGEEISTAEIAQSLNMSIYYIPMLSIIHNDHQSTTLSSWKENFHHSKKTYYYLKEKYRS